MKELAGLVGTTDIRLRSEQPEVAERLFNCRNLVWWAGILFGGGS
jgi:hypothetical protein